MNVVIEHPPIQRAGKLVLEAGSIEIPALGNVGLIGANGAGKSSLLLAMAGLIRRSPAAAVSRLWSNPRTFLMPQEPAVPLWLTSEQIAGLYQVDWTTTVNSLPDLRLQELSGKTAGAMSGGQRQVLMFALAIGADANVTLLDEPFSNLDLPRRYAAIRIMRKATRGLVFISAQSTADVVDCCDWYVVLREGRYAFCGSVVDLLGSGWHDDPSRQQRLEQRLLELTGFADAAVAN
jgi:ABC-type multidrug transport system ATPase subunit